MPDRKVVQGTLELLILRTLLFGPLHGHGIAKHIQRTSEAADDRAEPMGSAGSGDCPGAQARVRSQRELARRGCHEAGSR